MLKTYRIIYIISIVFLLFVQNSYSFELKTVGNKIVVNKYYLNGVPIWTEAHKQAILVSSPTVKDADFVVAVSTTEQAIIDELNDEAEKKSKGLSREKAIAEIKKRNSNDYNLEQAMEVQGRILAYEQLKARNPSFSIKVATDTLAIELQKYQGRIK